MKEKKPLKRDPDVEIVSRCKKDDVGAFEELVIKYQERLQKTAYCLTNDHGEACDAVQDAFLSAYKNIKKFKKESNFYTWICRIVINCSKDRNKKRKRDNKHVPNSIDAPVMTKSGPAKMDFASSEHTVDKHFEKKDKQSKVWQCIDTLGTEFRDVIVLKDMLEFSYKEICDMLEIRMGTVKSRLSRARDGVKNCLERIMGDI